MCWRFESGLNCSFWTWPHQAISTHCYSVQQREEFGDDAMLLVRDTYRHAKRVALGVGEDVCAATGMVPDIIALLSLPQDYITPQRLLQNDEHAKRIYAVTCRKRHISGNLITENGRYHRGYGLWLAITTGKFIDPKNCTGTRCSSR